MLQSSITPGPSGQPVYQSLVQPIAVTAPSNGYASHGLLKFNRRKAIGIGTTLIVAAVLGMIANGIDIIYNDYYLIESGMIGHGFWVGAVVIVAGAFGIAAAKRKTRGLITTFNILCIVAASLDAVQFIISISFAAELGSRYGCSQGYYSRCPKVSAAMQAVLAALAVVEAITAICGSVMCCKAACCCAGCCDTTPVAQTLMINDVPLTVIYQPRNHAVSVAYPVAVQPGGLQTTCQTTAQNFVASPPPYDSNIGQATSLDLQTSGAAASLDQSAFDFRCQEEKRRL